MLYSMSVFNYSDYLVLLFCQKKSLIGNSKGSLTSPIQPPKPGCWNWTPQGVIFFAQNARIYVFCSSEGKGVLCITLLTSVCPHVYPPPPPCPSPPLVLPQGGDGGPSLAQNFSLQLTVLLLVCLYLLRPQRGNTV